MLTDYEDDFFFEEDKILSASCSAKMINPVTENISLIEIEKIETNCKEFYKGNKNDIVISNKNDKLIKFDEDEKIIKSNNDNNYDIDDDINCIRNDDTNIEIEIIEEIVDPISYDGSGGNVTISSSSSSSAEEQQYKTNYACQIIELERLGMTVTSGSVVIKKDQTNLIGISIGGGAPLCPCLYIVQVFDNTPAAREGTLQSGDELLGVNGNSVKGKTKVEVAKMIQAATDEVTIYYNKLHADPIQGESLDIVLKKIKHRLVEAMSSSTADTLGLSRAILCNDSLVKRLKELQSTEQMYKGLVEHAKRMLKAYFDLLQTFQDFGNSFAAISVREPQPRASEVFRLFGELHRQMEKDGVKMLKTVKPILSDLGTYLNKAIPDTKMTIRRYADAKFTYLSYCLKVKEMDDEEHSYAALQEPLYRVETGNYEYRLILRCRQEARNKFAKLRNDVLEKMELLESKHARDLAIQLKRFIEGLAKLGTDTVNHLNELPNLFPVEVDLKESAFQYKTNEIYNADLDIDELPSSIMSETNFRNNTLRYVARAEEAIEIPTIKTTKISEEATATKTTSLLSTNHQSNNNSSNCGYHHNYQQQQKQSSSDKQKIYDNLLTGFEEIDLNPLSQQTVINNSSNNCDTLLAELGLQDIDLSITSNNSSNNKFTDQDNQLSMMMMMMMSTTDTMTTTGNNDDEDLLK